VTGAAGTSYLPFPRLRSRVRGRTGEPAWTQIGLAALLVGAALLYLVGLGASGWGNAFYAAAVQAGSTSWKAFFFGSFDSSSFITVDKPPASLWVMDLSARVFGVNAWSILVPQALEGVASVWLLYATVKRRFGAGAGLLAGAVLALTPVAVLMFRFDNPDALLTLLLVGAAYALTRALEAASTRWLAFAGALIGFAFLTKMLQALIVVPGFALVYLLAAPTPLRRRLVQLLAAGAALVVSAGWWVAIVAAWPASSRPYIGGSQHNSILELVFGYNGFGRLTGNESGSVVGGGGQGAAGAWGPTGITRLFGAEMGTQASWLLPAALIAIPVLLVAWRRLPRTDGRRAAVLIWGSWLVVTGLVLSYAQGIIHPYYTVVLGPAVGALVGIGAVWSWRHRAELHARLAASVALSVTVIWADRLLARSPEWHPWLRQAVLVAGLVAAAAYLLPPALVARGRIAGATLGTAMLLALVAAPAATSFQTASVAHTGAIPTAGPSTAGGFGRFGGGPGGFGGANRFGGARQGFGAGGARRFGGAPRGFQGGGFQGGAPQGFGARGGFVPPAGGNGGFGRGGGLGGLLDASTPSAALVKLLRQDASSYTWVAAAIGSNDAAGVQLATGHAVMAIGGFNGTDPTPTLAQFQQDVAGGKIHYFLGAGGFGRGSGSSSSAIASWVEQHFTSTSVGGVTVYDLSSPASSSTATTSTGTA
jgi:4-amino-4-deoxy-L-arabinose transferase-like glycosyltransferase